MLTASASSASRPSSKSKIDWSSGSGPATLTFLTEEEGTGLGFSVGGDRLFAECRWNPGAAAVGGTTNSQRGTDAALTGVVTPRRAKRKAPWSWGFKGFRRWGTNSTVAAAV